MDSGEPEGYNPAVRIANRNRMITSAAVVALCLALYATIGAQPGIAQSNPAATQPAGQPGQITGHVYRADNNEPIPRATVSLNPMGGRGVNVTARSAVHAN